MEGEVNVVSAVELGADMNGSEIRRSCGETVPMLVELESLPFRSNTVGIAGEEYAVVEEPPKAANASSKSKSWRFILCCGMLPVLCGNNGTGGRAGRFWFCTFKAADDDGADEA